MARQQATLVSRLDILRERVGLDTRRYVVYNVNDSQQSYGFSIKTIQIVIDENLLQKVDQATHDQNIHRSQFIRKALEDTLLQLDILEMEQKYLAGCHQHPVTPGEFDGFLPGMAVFFGPGSGGVVSRRRQRQELSLEIR